MFLSFTRTLYSSEYRESKTASLELVWCVSDADMKLVSEHIMTIYFTHGSGLWVASPEKVKPKTSQLELKLVIVSTLHFSEY